MCRARTFKTEREANSNILEKKNNCLKSETTMTAC